MEIKTLHLIIYSPLYEFGGGRETWLQYFIIHIKEIYNKIYIYCLYDKKMMKFTQLENVEIVPLSIYQQNRIWRYLTFVKNTKIIINNINLQFRNDILAMGTVHEGLCLYRIKKRFKKNVNAILWIRNMGVKERNYNLKKLLGKFELITLKSADYIISNGWDTKEYYQKKIQKEIKVIPNAVETNIYSKLKITNYYPDKLIIGYLGRFTEVKGFKFFEALSMDLSLLKYFQFEAWGWGEINNINIYKGKYAQRDLLSILERLDIVVFFNSNKKYWGGGVSHSLLEAMSAGKIIVAWDNFTHRQVLNENNSFLVEEENYEALKNKLLEIKDTNPRVLTSKRKQARVDSEIFSIENHIKTYVEYLKLN